MKSQRLQKLGYIMLIIASIIMISGIVAVTDNLEGSGVIIFSAVFLYSVSIGFFLLDHFTEQEESSHSTKDMKTKNTDNITHTLRDLKSSLDEGLIDEETFNKKKQKLLDKI